MFNNCIPKVNYYPQTTDYIEFINTYNRYGVSRLSRILENAGNSNKLVTLPPSSMDDAHKALSSLPKINKHKRISLKT